jgi:pimeloyl-ACP methyl ester carboxylesterase
MDNLPTTGGHMRSTTGTRKDPNVEAAQESALREGGPTPELLLEVNDATICAQAFGRPEDPALLLVQGACASMIRWEDDFCEQLVEAGRYVIRFDNRDVGRSTAYTPGEPPYDLNDLADDAVGLLDAFGIQRAHFVGASSGGMIAQLVGIRHPSRVLTLTLCISTPGVPAAAHAVNGSEGERAEDLPSPSVWLLEQVRALAAVDWTDEAAAVEAAVAEARAMAGSRFPVDEACVRAWAPREYGRQNDVLSFRLNTPIAETRTPPWRNGLRRIAAPTLVVHGTEDPVLPHPHGVALAEEIPGASLLTVDGMGHELPRGAWPQIVPAIVAHTERS